MDMGTYNPSQRGAQIIYFSHGGGPLPILGNASHQKMVEFMQDLPTRLERPEAILVISAHWEEDSATLLGAERPEMYYDYYGFPDEAYQLTYPAPGHPKLAKRIAGFFRKNNMPHRIDTQRGFDHGVFIPLSLMYPQADIPVIQLSLLRNLDPHAHYSLGEGLREAIQQKVLVIGSGASFHNLRAFSWEGSQTPDPANDAFQDWLIELCTGSITQAERQKRLIEWEKAPSARYCHPREEHLLPLHVCLGLANKAAKVVFDDYTMGKRGLAFSWS